MISTPMTTPVIVPKKLEAASDFLNRLWRPGVVEAGQSAPFAVGGQDGTNGEVLPCVQKPKDWPDLRRLSQLSLRSYRPPGPLFPMSNPAAFCWWKTTPTPPR